VSECGEKISARKDVVVVCVWWAENKNQNPGKRRLRTLRSKGAKKPRSASALPEKPLKNTPRAFTRSHDLFFHVARCASYPIPSVVWSLFFSTTNRPPRKGIKDERNAREAIDRASRRANDRKNGRNAYLDHFRELFYILRSFCAYNKS